MSLSTTTTSFCVTITCSPLWIWKSHRTLNPIVSHCMLKKINNPDFQTFVNCPLQTTNANFRQNIPMPCLCCISLSSERWKSVLPVDVAWNPLQDFCVVIMLHSRLHSVHLSHSILSQCALCWTTNNTNKWKCWHITLKQMRHLSSKGTWC